MSLHPQVTFKDLSLTRHSEGLRLVAYPDNGVAIGYGSHVEGIKVGDTCTVDQAEKWLVDMMNERVDMLNAWLVYPPPNQHATDALLDWLYNEPPAETEKSTLIAYAKRGLWDLAWSELPCWKYDNDKVDLGLWKRRRLEQALWKYGEWQQYNLRVHNQHWWPELFDTNNL